MKVALVYDRVNKWGGAERVLRALWEIWPDAPLYTAVYNPSTAPWAKGHEVIPSFLQRIPFAKNHHEWFFWATPYAFESFDFSLFDVVISITSAESKSIITSPHQFHLCYLLTPTRYLWSHTHSYAGSGLKKTILNLLFSRARNGDYIAAQRPDEIVAISKTVAQRTKKYYHRPVSQVIYPPVDTHKFANHPEKCFTKEGDYFLVVSRLVGYKAVDLVIQAFKDFPKEKLLVVGEGSEAENLKAKAPDNVSFLGQVSDEHLSCLYHHAAALIFPQEEDFGIVSLEAQSAGTPVIALEKGGATETVIADQTGILYSEASVTALKEALAAFKTHTWYDKTIQANAKQYDKAVFIKLFKEFVEDRWKTRKKLLFEP